MLTASLPAVLASVMLQLEIVLMAVTLAPHDVATNEKQVAQVEKLVGTRLPEDYRAFLLKNNGATPETDENKYDYVGFTIQWRGQSWGGRYREAMLDALYSLDRYAPLPWWDAFEDFSKAGRIPKDTMPIGLDPGGNQILLGISGVNRGKVFFWAMDEAPIDDDAPVTHDNVGLIADSFADFVKSLHAWKDEL